MECPFCNFLVLSKRIFYKNNKWFAFLAAPPHTKGHSIIAALSRSNNCPSQPNVTNLSGLDIALSEVIKAIKKQYFPKDVLLASVRGDVKHFHVHLIPLYKNEEHDWRKITGYKDSHLLEFLGSLEKKRDFKLLELMANGVSEKKQRSQSEKKLEPEVKELRKITRYNGMPKKQIQRMR